jgi:Tol biopolymer transport system component
MLSAPARRRHRFQCLHVANPVSATWWGPWTGRSVAGMRRALLISALTLIPTAVFAAPAGATFPGENGPILFRTLDFDTGFGTSLLRANPDGTGVTAINRRPGGFSDWRADGRRIVFEFLQRDGDVQIASARPDGSGVRVLTSGPGIHEIPSWSPSGRRIVFGYSPHTPDEPEFRTRLMTMRPDGSRTRPLPMRRPGFDVEPRYSPNGRWIAFARLRKLNDKGDFKTALMIVRARGGRVRRLTPWADWPAQLTPRNKVPEHPTWSPDSRWILFNLGPNGTIRAMRPDGSDRRTIVPAREGFGGHKPQYSPDGRQILFVCEKQGTLPEPPEGQNDDICVMNADGSNVVNLTNTPEKWENWPSWGPAPR